MPLPRNKRRQPHARQQINNVQGWLLTILWQEHVAPAAFHNFKQRVYPPCCHAHTREAVLDEPFAWIVGNVLRETWVT
ncbi:hypothetical protein HYPSUDRAFT_209402 [Hypholoma sublateritium FD-334 SS-4]|uniref:Uncharacterized protein n=1 Tax=Hypholoma sublateritium (strain FD-334 SS-4) TaxID=945553 RepID=A0A0D2NYT8_HYPSF|nr:hypothetical protein HYPSUDRAFT_209402 [Hypholoma sublateritium FD-334 SS-4]